MRPPRNVRLVNTENPAPDYFECILILLFFVKYEVPPYANEPVRVLSHVFDLRRPCVCDVSFVRNRVPVACVRVCACAFYERLEELFFGLVVERVALRK